MRCFKHFDAYFTGLPQKLASFVATSNGVDTNWYMDSGATDHITGELEKLTIRDKYHGGDRVHAANGTSMEISHVGHSTLHSPLSKIHLRNILHVFTANKNLVNKLTRDNNVFLEFHPDHFVIKEQMTRKPILRGQCEGGLYPIKSSSSRSVRNKEALSVLKPPTSVWHSRFGHAAALVVQQILSHHKLSFVKDLDDKHVCDACQQGKSH